MNSLSWEILLGPLIGFVLLYGAASMIKHNVFGLDRWQNRALFAIKGMGALFVIGFFAWATGLWNP